METLGSSLYSLYHQVALAVKSRLPFERRSLPISRRELRSFAGAHLFSPTLLLLFPEHPAAWPSQLIFQDRSHSLPEDLVGSGWLSSRDCAKVSFRRMKEERREMDELRCFFPPSFLRLRSLSQSSRSLPFVSSPFSRRQRSLHLLFHLPLRHLHSPLLAPFLLPSIQNRSLPTHRRFVLPRLRSAPHPDQRIPHPSRSGRAGYHRSERREIDVEEF